jgi:hypothetical protein
MSFKLKLKSKFTGIINNIQFILQKYPIKYFCNVDKTYWCCLYLQKGEYNKFIIKIIKTMNEHLLEMKVIISNMNYIFNDIFQHLSNYGDNIIDSYVYPQLPILCPSYIQIYENILIKILSYNTHLIDLNSEYPPGLQLIDTKEFLYTSSCICKVFNHKFNKSLEGTNIDNILLHIIINIIININDYIIYSNKLALSNLIEIILYSFKNKNMINIVFALDNINLINFLKKILYLSIFNVKNNYDSYLELSYIKYISIELLSIMLTLDYTNNISNSLFDIISTINISDTDSVNLLLDLPMSFITHIINRSVI